MNKKEQFVFRSFTSQGFDREDAFKKMKTQIAKEGTMDKQQAMREAEEWDKKMVRLKPAIQFLQSCGLHHCGGNGCWYSMAEALTQYEEASREALMPALVEAMDALQKCYTMLVSANLKDRPAENQRCGRCDYCEALLSNADDDDCGECYVIVKALATLNAIIGEKK